MTDNRRATDYLAESVRHSIAAIERGIKAYVFDGDESAYRVVATELRKLLVDLDAVRSFHKSIKRAKKAKNLFELCYGNSKNILLKSFRSTQYAQSDDYVDVTPNIYSVREDILYCATHGGDLVPMKEWLDEQLVYFKNGEVKKVGTVINYITGKEGSHIINPVGDKREDIAIAFTSGQPTQDEIENIDFNYTNPWRQFAIDAGMRLLSAKNVSGGRLIEHTIDVPRTPSRFYASGNYRIQKKKKSLGGVATTKSSKTVV